MTVGELKEKLQKCDDGSNLYYYNSIEGYFVIEDISTQPKPNESQPSDVILE